MAQKTALISVYNKQGIIEFAAALVELGWRILSSGGTAQYLANSGIPVVDVAQISGLPAVLGHRVVTLVPQVHGGLLATDDQLAELESLGWPRIDLVCVDLYPLKEEIAKPDATQTSVIEKTDIGGPTMLRSAAKGRRIVIADPADRGRVIEWLQAGKPNEEAFVTRLCAKSEFVVADYVLASARYHSAGVLEGFTGKRALECKYGENAWQKPAALYSMGSADPLALDKFVQVAGAPPSYNNLCDLDRMLQTATHMAAAWEGAGPLSLGLAVKHGNACGASLYLQSAGDEEKTLRERVLMGMIDGDKRAIFGGLVMVNFQINEALADVLLRHGMESGVRILDGIAAPSFTPGAVEMMKRSKDRCRFLANPALERLSKESLDSAMRFRYIRGGFLAQPNYTMVPDFSKLKDHAEPGHPPRRDILLAWAIGATSNSNTITLVKDGMLLGNGVGQQDRVGGCKLAIHRAREAGHDVRGAVAYSDSFFPFPDGPAVLIEAGIEAIFATSGSVRDKETIALCKEKGVSLYLLPDEDARGFFGH